MENSLLAFGEQAARITALLDCVTIKVTAVVIPVVALYTVVRPVCCFSSAAVVLKRKFRKGAMTRSPYNLRLSAKK